MLYHFYDHDQYSIQPQNRKLLEKEIGYLRIKLSTSWEVFCKERAWQKRKRRVMFSISSRNGERKCNQESALSKKDANSYSPKIGFMTPGSEEGNWFRMEDSEEKTVNITLVCCERRVIKTPIVKIIGSAIAIPFLSWKIKSDLHPMPLSLIVPILGRIASTWVRMKWHSYTNQECKDSNT